MQDFDTYRQNAKQHLDVAVTAQTLALYGKYDGVRKENFPAVALAVTVKEKGKTHYAIIVASRDFKAVVAGNPNLATAPAVFSIHCGDGMLEGRKPRSERIARLKGAFGSSEVLHSQYPDLFNGSAVLKEEADACNFWNGWRRDRVLCKHTEHALAYLRDEQTQFQQQMLEMLDDALSKLDQETAEKLKALAAGEPYVPSLEEPDVRDPWVHMATAFLDLSLSLNDMYVERHPGSTQTVLSVYSDRKNSQPDFFVQVERQADINVAKSVHQAVSQRMMHGLPVRSAQVTAKAELVVDSTLASLMHSNQISCKLQVVTY